MIKKLSLEWMPSLFIIWFLSLSNIRQNTKAEISNLIVCIRIFLKSVLTNDWQVILFYGWL